MEVVYERAWNQDVSWKLDLGAWWRTLSRSRILSWSRVPNNLRWKNVIIDLEVLKAAACPSPHRNSTTWIKLEKILHLMALKPLRINPQFALHNFCNALRFNTSHQNDFNIDHKGFLVSLSLWAATQGCHRPFYHCSLIHCVALSKLLFHRILKKWCKYCSTVVFKQGLQRIIQPQKQHKTQDYWPHSKWYLVVVKIDAALGNLEMVSWAYSMR